MFDVLTLVAVSALCAAFGYCLAGAPRPFYGSRRPESVFFITERGEEALADAYAREHGSRDSPETAPMCGCGNCDGDLGPTVLAMHAELKRILEAPDA